jgi:hypothetical protein
VGCTLQRCPSLHKGNTHELLFSFPPLSLSLLGHFLLLLATGIRLSKGGREREGQVFSPRQFGFLKNKNKCEVPMESWSPIKGQTPALCEKFRKATPPLPSLLRVWESSSLTIPCFLYFFETSVPCFPLPTRSLILATVRTNIGSVSSLCYSSL